MPLSATGGRWALSWGSDSQVWALNYFSVLLPSNTLWIFSCVFAVIFFSRVTWFSGAYDIDACFGFNIGFVWFLDFALT